MIQLIVSNRVKICRLVDRIEKNKEYCEKIGITNKSKYFAEPTQKTYHNENKDYKNG